MQASISRGPRLPVVHRAAPISLVVSVFIAFLILSACSVPGHAQYAASLQGTVADPTGAVIPDAKVTLTDKETNRTLTAQSNGSGTYTIGALEPSNYKVEVSRTGFKNKVVDNVRILANQPNALNVTLEVGATSAETVTVNAASEPVIDTATGQLGSTVSQNEISHLPSYGRDVYQLVQLAPGMFGDQSQAGGGGTNNLPGNQGPGGSGANNGIFSTENRPQAFASGGRNDTNNVTLDGVGVTSVTWGGAAVITPNEDSVKEVKIVSNSYAAEWGRTSGAQIQVWHQQFSRISLYPG